MLKRFSGQERFILIMAVIALLFLYSALLSNGEEINLVEEGNESFVENIADQVEHIDEQYIYLAKAKDGE